MANQDDSSDSTLRSMPELSMPQLAYEEERSNWSQNHGPVLIATAVFVLIVGSGVIFFNSVEIVDNSRPLVPNNFVPDGATDIEISDESAPTASSDKEDRAGENGASSQPGTKTEPN